LDLEEAQEVLEGALVVLVAVLEALVVVLEALVVVLEEDLETEAIGMVARKMRIQTAKKRTLR
jgi:hypothetical protein